MSSNQSQGLIRQALFGFFRWVLPTLILFLLIPLPSWTPRQLLWNSTIADWFFRIFLTIVFVSWHRTHAKAFMRSKGVADTKRQPAVSHQVVATNHVVALFILASQVLVGAIVIAYFTWFAIDAFVPALKSQQVLTTAVHVCFVILPWLSYRQLDSARDQTRDSLLK
jgi:hypothetical protein